MTADALDAVFGWQPGTVRRNRLGLVMVSWFPINSIHAVLYSADNKAPLPGRFHPVSRALDEGKKRTE